MVTRGSYCLCIRVKRKKEVKIGSLGPLAFSKGYYVYVGSALNSLTPRLVRHLKTQRGEGRATHWHIDYLLREPGVEIEAIYVTDWAIRIECEIAAKIAERGEPVPRFGCSDCDCRSHLYKVDSLGVIEETGLKKIDLSTLPSSQSPL